MTATIRPMYRSTREFVAALDTAGLLQRIRVPVSPILEITEITDRVSKSLAGADPTEAANRFDPKNADSGGKALLFENVEGSDIPVLINQFGSYRRLEIALGCHGDDRFVVDGHTSGGFDGIAARIADLVELQPPQSLREVVGKAREFLPLLRIGPKRVRNALCQEVIYLNEHVDLRMLPIIKCWPLDGDFEAVGYPAGINDEVPGVDATGESIGGRGRYITLAGVYTIHPRDRHKPSPARQNIGMYRVQMLGPRTLAMHWHMHHDGAAHWRAWKDLGEEMPVAIVLGGESVLPYAATAPLPPGISEVLMAGFLNRGGIPLVRCKTNPMWVPANAEIVIEGMVSTDAGFIGYDPHTDGPLGPGAVFEGPFGDHTGYYSMPDRYPTVRVTALTHRRAPIYPTTVVGLPPQEDYYLGKATERVFLPLLKTVVHDIEDYHLPLFGAFHNCAFIQIRKTYPMQARRVMHAIWGAGQMAWTKMIVVVDSDVDVHDATEVFRAIARHCVPQRDTETVFGPLDILDHAAPRLGVGAKLGFDATPRLADEVIHSHVPQPDMRPMHKEARTAYVSAVEKVDGVVGAYIPANLGDAWLFVNIDKVRAGQGRETVERIRSIPTSGGDPRFIIVLAQKHLDVRDINRVLFHWCANTAFERDAVWFDGRVAFDATPKGHWGRGDEFAEHPVRPWPPVIEMSPEISERVTQRWVEYGFEDDLERARQTYG